VRLVLRNRTTAQEQRSKVILVVTYRRISSVYLSERIVDCEVLLFELHPVDNTMPGVLYEGGLV